MLFHGVDAAVETVLLVFDTGGEEERVGRLVLHAVAERDAPQSFDDYVLVVARAQSSEVCTDERVEGVDLAVTEVADEQQVAEAAEARGRERHAPRRVEGAVRDQALQEEAVGVEHVDDAEPGTRLPHRRRRD